MVARSIPRGSHALRHVDSEPTLSLPARVHIILERKIIGVKRKHTDYEKYDIKRENYSVLQGSGKVLLSKFMHSLSPMRPSSTKLIPRNPAVPEQCQQRPEPSPWAEDCREFDPGRVECARRSG